MRLECTLVTAIAVAMLHPMPASSGTACWLLSSGSTSRLEVVPPEPMATDSVTLRFVGDWCMGTPPTFETPSLPLEPVTILSATATAGGPAAVVPFSRLVPLGQLPPGTYTVRARVLIEFSAGEVIEEHGPWTFQVSAAPAVPAAGIPALLALVGLLLGLGVHATRATPAGGA